MKNRSMMLRCFSHVRLWPGSFVNFVTLQRPILFMYIAFSYIGFSFKNCLTYKLLPINVMQCNLKISCLLFYILIEGTFIDTRLQLALSILIILIWVVLVLHNFKRILELCGSETTLIEIH